MQRCEFSQRLAQLRTQKGVSARDMSLSLGQSASYINKIENQQALPSMNGFFYICDYLQIEPQDFFDKNIIRPTTLKQTITLLEECDEATLLIIEQLLRKLTKKDND